MTWSSKWLAFSDELFYEMFLRRWRWMLWIFPSWDVKKNSIFSARSSWEIGSCSNLVKQSKPSTFLSSFQTFNCACHSVSFPSLQCSSFHSLSAEFLIFPPHPQSFFNVISYLPIHYCWAFPFWLSSQEHLPLFCFDLWYCFVLTCGI